MITTMAVISRPSTSDSYRAVSAFMCSIIAHALTIASAFCVCYSSAMNKITFADLYNTLTQPEKRALAESANTTTQYLYQIATGRRKPGINVAARLKRSDNRITDSMLRPDLYA